MHDSIHRFDFMVDIMGARSQKAGRMAGGVANQAAIRSSLIATLVALSVTAAFRSAPVLAGDAGIVSIIERGRPTTTLEIDNDSLLLQRDDGLYTSGLRLTRTYRVREAGGWRSLSWRFGQQLYTPHRVTIPPEQLGPLDRPYAGWLYGGMAYRVEADDGSELAFGLDLGCLGPCAGGEPTQKFLHRVLSQPKPLGWDTQMGSEAGLVAHLGARAPAYRLSRSADLRPGVALRLGNIFTDMMLEASLRAGRLRAGGEPAGADTIVYGFLRAGVRSVIHDATLEGGLLSDDPGRTVKPRRGTGELEAGMHWQRAAWAWRISVVTRSNEIDGLPESVGRSSFLRLVISYSP